MKQVILIVLILISISLNAHADRQDDIDGCQIADNHFKELPDTISKTIPIDEGVESVIIIPLAGARRQFYRRAHEEAGATLAMLGK